MTFPSDQSQERLAEGKDAIKKSGWPDDDVAEFEAELAGACKRCLGKGQVEVMGDGANFEWDVIGYKVCGDCNGTGLKQSL